MEITEIGDFGGAFWPLLLLESITLFFHQNLSEMALLTINHVNFSSEEINPSLNYRTDETEALLEQAGAYSYELVRVKVNVNVVGVTAPSETTARIAIDEYGYQLKEGVHLVVLPCPPYCSKGRGGRE